MTPKFFKAMARQEQAKKAVPLIGPLLDAWDNVPNDAKDYVMVCSPGFGELMDKLNDAMGADDERSKWWCPTCDKWLEWDEVTYEETHDERGGGCGYSVLPEKPGETDVPEPPREDDCTFEMGASS